MSSIGRREFLKQSAGASAALIVGFYLPDAAVPAPQPSRTFAPNAFVRIGADETITIVVNKSEMGQGVYTSLPMILADELEADWSKVRVESAPVAPEYNHTMFGVQLTGGSTSVRSSYDQLRQAGAMARALLVSAAAQCWGAPVTECHAEKGYVVHGKRRLSFGQLASTAAKLPPPQQVRVKDPSQFRFIGKPVQRTDTVEKVTGKAQFGIDVAVPGMLVALVARPPMFGGKLKSFDSTKAKAVPGVRHVVSIDTGVAVVAKGFWAASRGRNALQVEWDAGPSPGLTTADLFARYAKEAEQPGVAAREPSEAERKPGSPARTIEAVYEFPYLAHATMEPLNCVADVRADGCEIWTGTQFQTGDRDAAAEVAGLPKEKVKLHTMLLGGGFGRRAVPSSHFVREAVQISKVVGAPVKVIWTREDDMQGGYYRPMYHHKLRVGVDRQGHPVDWKHDIVGQSILAGTPFGGMAKNGVDPTSVEGVADTTYSIPNMTVRLHTTELPVPVLWLRSVGHTHNAFVMETMIDELAHEAGQDPLDYRRSLLARHPRQLAVLELATSKAGWGTPLPRGRARGMAAHFSFESYIADVAEVSQDASGSVRVHRVVTAIDCGQVINPDIVRAQMEGVVNFALSLALYGRITLQDGRPQQSNFDDYPIVRMSEAPEIEVHIVSSSAPLGGVGEPGVPPLAPAVANALFAITGRRVRRLPLINS